MSLKLLLTAAKTHCWARPRIADRTPAAIATALMLRRRSGDTAGAFVVK
jgi:hypothetical protein